MTLEENRLRLLEEAKNHAASVARCLIEASRLEQEIKLEKPPLEPNTIRLAETRDEARILDWALLSYIGEVEKWIEHLYDPKPDKDRSREWEEVLGTALTLRKRLRSLGDWDKTTDVQFTFTFCPATDEGFSCVLPPNHTGDHEAKGAFRTLRRWKQVTNPSPRQEILDTCQYRERDLPRCRKSQTRRVVLGQHAGNWLVCDEHAVLLCARGKAQGLFVSDKPLLGDEQDRSSVTF